jgi:hypothetical protein
LSVVLREEYRLRVLEGKVLRNTGVEFGRGNRRAEKTLLKGELHDVHSNKCFSSDQIKKVEMGETCSTCWVGERFLRKK